MSIIDLNKLNTAITYIERMAEGNDPVKNIPVEEDAVINNPNVIRCMYFIHDVLMQVKANDGIVGSKKRAAKEPFPFEVLKDYVYQKDKSISHIMSQIKELVDNPNAKVIGYKVLTDWLKSAGYLVEEQDKYTGKKTTVPTERGKLYWTKGTVYLLFFMDHQSSLGVASFSPSILQKFRKR